MHISLRIHLLTNAGDHPGGLAEARTSNHCLSSTRKIDRMDIYSAIRQKVSSSHVEYFILSQQFECFDLCAL